MSQHDFDIANQGFPALRADLNLALVALAENSSGATEPSVKKVYMWWADTTNNLLKQRNAANSAWIVRGTLDVPGVLNKTGAYTVAPVDFGKLIAGDASGGDFTITLPVAATAGDGFTVAIKNTGASGVVTVDGDGAETIDGGATLLLSNQYAGVVLRCDGSAWHIATVPHALPPPDFTSSEQTVTLDTVLNIAHGLTAIPTLAEVVLRCKTAEFSYAVGDEIPAIGIGGTPDTGVSITYDATNVTVVQASQVHVISQGTLNLTNITVGSWKWVARAWS